MNDHVSTYDHTPIFADPGARLVWDCSCLLPRITRWLAWPLTGQSDVFIQGERRGGASSAWVCLGKVGGHAGWFWPCAGRGCQTLEFLFRTAAGHLALGKPYGTHILERSKRWGVLSLFQLLELWFVCTMSQLYTVMSLCSFVLHPSFTDLHCTCPLRLRTFTMKQPAEIRSPALELANLTSPNLFFERFESLASLSIVFALQCFVIATGLLWAKEGPNSFVVGLAWDRRCTDPCIKKTKSAEVCGSKAYLFQKLCSRRIYVWPDSRKQIACYLKTQGTTVEQEAGLIVIFSETVERKRSFACMQV